MGRVLRIPFLADLIRVDDPAQIRALAHDEWLDRNFTGHGPLLNRILTRKVRRVLAVDRVPLPSVAPRDDAERAGAQAALQVELDAAASAGFDDDNIAALAKAVCRYEEALILEHAVQEAVGRLFAKDYRATAETWAAAVLLDKAARSMNPLAAILWRITGQITRAQRLLAAKVHDDRGGVHATGIAVHNLVRGFAAMRDLLAAGDPLTREQVVARCLKAPASVLREAVPKSPGGADAIRPRTLVVLDLSAAQQRDAGPEILFMAESWSQCPASAWVPALIGAVWDRALRLRRRQLGSVGGGFRLEFARAEAARRRAIYRGTLGANLLLQLAPGIVMIVAPLWISHFVALPPTDAGLVRVWGLMLLLLTTLYAAGWSDPVYTRWPNVVGIAGRFATALLYLCLGRGFLWFALYEAVFAVALTWAYSQTIRAELMARP
jgi:hypothetical protein